MKNLSTQRKSGNPKIVRKSFLDWQGMVSPEIRKYFSIPDYWTALIAEPITGQNNNHDFTAGTITGRRDSNAAQRILARLAGMPATRYDSTPPGRGKSLAASFKDRSRGPFFHASKINVFRGNPLHVTNCIL